MAACLPGNSAGRYHFGFALCAWADDKTTEQSKEKFKFNLVCQFCMNRVKIQLNLFTTATSLKWVETRVDVVTFRQKNGRCREVAVSGDSSVLNFSPKIKNKNKTILPDLKM